MSRFSRQDSDEERLPEGMRRVGYDADTQRYQYRDEDGSFWEGPEGARYGMLQRAGTPRRPLSADEEHTLKKGNREAWGYMFPFLLLAVVFLLLLFRFLDYGSGSAQPLNCPEHSHTYTVKSGDTCWAIATDHGVELTQLTDLNPGLNCNKLMIGNDICVPARNKAE